MLTNNSELAVELLDNSPDSMMALSPEGSVVYWNKGAENTFGYSKDEALGRELTDLIIPSEGAEEEERFFAETLEFGHSSFESRRRKKDGSLIDFEISARVILDDQGRVRFVIS